MILVSGKDLVRIVPKYMINNFNNFEFCLCNFHFVQICHLYIFICMSSAALQLLQAFSLHKIASKAYEKHQQEKEKKRELDSRLTLSYIMS